MSQKQLPPEFKFRPHASIGAADAVDDQQFLQTCFVDNGELQILAEKDNYQSILLGRTGTGKTALLQMLKRHKERVIEINPDHLALTYLSNNQMLQFFIEAGVNMELFYRLLWRHIFAVEIIKAHRGISDEIKSRNIIAELIQLLQNDKKKLEAMKYVVEWGESFWKEVDYRVREVTENLLQDMKKEVSGGINAKLGDILTSDAQFRAETARSLSTEQKAEIVRLGQPVVDKRQIVMLSNVIKILDENILADAQKKYYITIDRLDENWVDDKLRYYLIRSLLETVKEFNNRITNLKIIIALREDLLKRVFRETRDSGHQEEKYASLYLNLRWSENSLTDLLNRRINALIKRQYTSTSIGIHEILPTRLHIGGEKVESLKYIFQRTFLRPRDAISFLNECLIAAEGSPIISQTNILDAEVQYSEGRFRALGDEWSADYPNLLDLCLLLQHFPPAFTPKQIDIDNLKVSMIDFILETEHKVDDLHKMVKEYYEAERIRELIPELLKIFYRVSLIGVKQQGRPIVWSFQGKEMPREDEDVTYQVHPAFWKVLKIQQPN